MFNISLKSCVPYMALAGTTLVSPVAFAGTPLTADNGNNAINSLNLNREQLSSKALESIRGGFDLGPNLSINFAFSQIDSIGSNIVQSIIVPITTLTQDNPNASATVSGSGGMPIAQLQMSGANIAQGISNFTPGNAGTSNTNTTNTTVVPTGGTNYAIQTVANQGMTSISTQLANNGITNIIQNQANAQMIQQMTSIQIGITGMTQWLSQQRTNSALTNSLSGASNFSH